VEISLEFARLLLEADQYAHEGTLGEARAVYQRMLKLDTLDPAERVLVESRLLSIESATAEVEESLQVVEREAVGAPPTDEARAETLANEGDLAGAIAIYQTLASAEPENDLAAERLAELRAARAEQDAATGAIAAAAVPVLEPEPDVATPIVEKAAETVQAAVAELILDGADWREGLPEDPVEMLQALLNRIRANRRDAA